MSGPMDMLGAVGRSLAPLLDATERPFSPWVRHIIAEYGLIPVFVLSTAERRGGGAAAARAWPRIQPE